MKDILKITKELWKSKNIVFRIAKYDNDQKYLSSYLGSFWQFADPVLQIGVMVMMFALRGNGNSDSLSVRITWITLGMVTYTFIQAGMLKSAKSIQSQMSFLAKMSFSLSAIPMTAIIAELRRYFIMMAFSLILIIFYMKVVPSLIWLQYAYYLFAMIVFLYVLSLLTSTITVLVPDFYTAYAAILRVGMWISGVIIPIDPPLIPGVLSSILKLNPIYYIIQGFRDTLLDSPVWFWEKKISTLIFWGIILIVLILGSHLHLKFRKKFMDYI